MHFCDGSIHFDGVASIITCFLQNFITELAWAIFIQVYIVRKIVFSQQSCCICDEVTWAWCSYSSWFAPTVLLLMK